MSQLIRLLISNLFQNFLILISNLKFIWKTYIYCISNMNSINCKNSKFLNQNESETSISKFWNSSDSNDDWEKKIQITILAKDKTILRNKSIW